MSKRTADESIDTEAAASSAKAVKPSTTNGKAMDAGNSSRRNHKSSSSGNNEDEGMGEFEDQWEDEMEEEEEDDEDHEDDDEEGAEGGDGQLRISGDIIEPEQDEDDQQPQPETQVYLPSHGSRPLEADEILEPDHSVYQALHPLEYTWPALSFDVLRDNLGWERNRFPHTAYVVAGTQAGEAGGSGAGVGNNKAQDEVVVMKWAGLSKTQNQGDSDDEDEDEDDEGTDDDAHLEYLTIPHTGSVNRIRARPQAPAPALLPPMASQTPYHVATMAETGKVHIFDVRPLIDRLEDPAAAAAAASSLNGAAVDKAKRPVHTITNHGRSEGFAIDWHQDGRLLTGDLDGRIFLTSPNSSGTGFTTKPDPYTSHTSSIEDLQWSPSESTVFASCSADRSVKVWDVRVKNRKAVTGITGAHDQDVNVISWNKGVEYLLLSGGDEGGLKVWDLRNLKTGPAAQAAGRPDPVAQFTWHQAPITSVEWHPIDTSLFIAGSADDTVTMWDLGVEADDEEAASKNVTETGVVVPPQLLFVHQNQRDIKEVHWHPQIPGAFISTAGDGFNFVKTISA